MLFPLQNGEKVTTKDFLALGEVSFTTLIEHNQHHTHFPS